MGAPPTSTQVNHALNTAFSPDKRPNISRSQQMSNNNLYFKRGAKAQGPNNDKSMTRGDTSNNSRHHQRMFAPQTASGSTLQLNPTGGPNSSASPLKQGPGYLQSTFSHTKKTAQKQNTNNSNVNAYQLNRVRPARNQLQT